MKKKLIAITLISLALIPQSIPAQAATKNCGAQTQAIEEGPYYLANSPVRSDVTDGQSGKAMTYKFIVRTHPVNQ